MQGNLSFWFDSRIRDVFPLELRAPLLLQHLYCHQTELSFLFACFCGAFVFPLELKVQNITVNSYCFIRLIVSVQEWEIFPFLLRKLGPIFSIVQVLGILINNRKRRFWRIPQCYIDKHAHQFKKCRCALSKWITQNTQKPLKIT